ncbi:PREDICTED: uncharacterized protein LOC108569859 [Nicrophorus vespilloides]|uniref:Uncharacterized protein LOC108569859 n=1 Tax=Nicrophorus vespilloides TaxID=110193 RepID=A0ABM1NJQ6_NICVS|nr:PREDICTED: uncharacterized protein LOC108569859 [Nicrophorus vespilloides]
MYILIGLYGCLFLFGVYGNGTIALSLFRGPGIHQRNPFVIAMVFADLIVCIISIPMTVTSLTITWTVTAQPIFNFLQTVLAESIREPQPGTSRRDDPEEPEELFEPENSTLQCRRRLARYLLWMSIFFAVCWIPHVICTIYEELFNLEPSELQWYSLFLGHFHSAVSPTIYRSLNIQCPRPPTYRTPNPPRSDSSTNEAYLGPFHPRYFRPPPQRRNSSLCLF